MRKLRVNAELTLNGIMEAPHTWPSFVSDDVNAYKQQGMRQGGAMLFGRVTYEMFASFWPQQSNFIADYMNQHPKYVVSNTLEKADWQSTKVLRGDLEKNIRALKHEPGGDIVVLGSCTLIASLMRANLIDEYSLWLHPLLRAEGRRLFPEGVSAEFQLADTHAFAGGIVLLTYRPAGQKV